MAYELIYTENGIMGCSVTGYSGEPDIVVIPNTYNNKPVTSINMGTFRDCTSLTSIIIPDSVTGIGGQAFSGCTNLTNVTIGNNVTRISGSTFNGCTSLTNVTIGNSVKVIDEAAFSGCSGLTSIVIPDSVTEISYSVFSGCTSLTSVTIGKSVTSIGRYTFSGCTNLKIINLLSNTPFNIYSSTFDEIETDTTFYCFNSNIKNYKTATNWNAYANNFVADNLRLYFIMNSQSQKKYLSDNYLEKNLEKKLATIPTESVTSTANSTMQFVVVENGELKMINVDVGGTF